MTTVSTKYGTVAALTVATSLAASNYDLTGTVYNNTTNNPVDVLVEYVATAAAPSGNKQILLFVQGSFDGTTWGAGPSSTTDTTHDASMQFLGQIPVAAAETERRAFSVAAAFGGSMTPYWRLVVKNDLGAALSSCSARTQEITYTAA